LSRCQDRCKGVQDWVKESPVYSMMFWGFHVVAVDREAKMWCSFLALLWYQLGGKV
jgi:hypothetical protein